jgi:hypothetical protein
MTDPRTIEFQTFIYTSGLRQLTKDDLAGADAQKAIDACPHRSGVRKYERRGVALEGARCALLANRLGWQVGLERKCCAACQLHGGPDDPANASLESHAKILIYGVSIPNPSLGGVQEKPLPEMLEKAAAAAKALIGADAARDLITTMVATAVVTPEEAVALHDRLRLFEITPIEGAPEKELLA